ncbi:MAG TPA: hypothetical protein VF630_08990 [Hymenobacter sp.]|jgi:hypothetical protein
MHFAKLFTWPAGQLLVQLEDSDEEDLADTPHLVTCKTKHPSGVTLAINNCYADEKARDADFESFDEEKALTLFTKQHRVLENMAG